MALPKEALAALRQQSEMVDENEVEAVPASAMGRSRRKRMHHLSILRKVGTPNGHVLGSRLFGPQKQTRELKRTVPLFLVEY